MIIDGTAIANQIQAELKTEIQKIPGRKPALAVILVGEHPASQIYVNRKVKACETVGIRSVKIVLSDTTAEQQLIQEIEKLNRDSEIDGILVQLPLPSPINPLIVAETIRPEKDVDGVHPLNIGKLLIGREDGFIPCTPLGIKTLLHFFEVDMKGKNALIIGRSNIVGKPMAALLMQNTAGSNATVTLANSYTKNLEDLCSNADLLVAAIGVQNFIKAEMVKEGAVVIDVGINRLESSSEKGKFKLVGDVDFQNVQHKASLITPVPGGVGPMTITMLLSNTLRAYYKHLKGLIH